MQLREGEKVRLRTPDNPRLDGAAAVVVRPEPWGAHVATEAAATGRFRALFSEMELLVVNAGAVTTRSVAAGGQRADSLGAAAAAAKDHGYTGDFCDVCGSSKMRRNGSCLLCEGCGTTSGCS